MSVGSCNPGGRSGEPVDDGLLSSKLCRRQSFCKEHSVNVGDQVVVVIRQKNEKPIALDPY
jgi:hypothetical protein